ncbi:MAG: MFS transporter [Gammaproteobacteria bacterium]
MSADQNAASRGLGRLLSKVAPIEPREVPAVVIAFCLFFCVFAGYFAVRPVRETIGTVLGKQRVADLFVVTWIASVAIIPIYGYLVGKFRRSVFLPWIYGGIAVALAAVGLVLKADETNIASGQFFYVFISVLNLFIVSVFWSFLLELFTQQQSKRLFGIIAAGGTVGALVGPFFTDMAVAKIGNSGVLFFGAFMFVLTLFFQRALLKLWSSGADTGGASTETAGASSGGGKVRGDRPIGGNPFAGFSKVLSSPYLLGIALFVVFIATINTFLYFEQMRLVEAAFENTADRTRIFARLDWIVQTLTVVCQVFLTGRIASKLGLTTLLIIVPIVMIGGFLSLAATGTLMVLMIVFVARRVGEYAFVRPAREMLFSRVDTETKYKAKNVIDVPVYRGADALSAQVNTAITSAGSTPAHIAILGAGVAVAWLVNGWFLGRKADAADASDKATAAAAQAAASRGH